MSLPPLAAAPFAGPTRILLVTGMSGAGKSTALKALEDIGYEAVDNMPLRLLRRLLKVEDGGDAATARPLAVGVDARTRAFDAEDVVERLKKLRADDIDVRVLFLDCAGGELTRRFSETRRRHPLAQDRPAADGIAREREMLSPLRRWADAVIDTTDSSINDLRRAVIERFGTRDEAGRLTLTCMSFGFARGLPRDADLVFDMRFLANPHWEAELRPLTGLDPKVGAFVAADPAYDPAFERIAELLAMLIPRYAHEGKSYLTMAFGCTGGRHRSVHVAEAMAARLRGLGYEPSVVHRDLKGRGDAAHDMSELELGRRGESMTA